jgi:hypothetical protein
MSMRAISLALALSGFVMIWVAVHTLAATAHRGYYQRVALEAIEHGHFLWNETKTKRAFKRQQVEAFEAGADAVLRGLGLNPDDYRTDFGNLNLPNVRDAIARAEWIDRYRELARNALAANA